MATPPTLTRYYIELFIDGQFKSVWVVPHAEVDAFLQEKDAEITELRRARIGDAEIIGRWQCQAEAAALRAALMALEATWRREAFLFIRDTYDNPLVEGGPYPSTLRRCADDLAAILAARARKD